MDIAFARKINFEIQKDGVAKVNKFFTVAMMTTYTSNSQHEQNPKHLMKRFYFLFFC